MYSGKKRDKKKKRTWKARTDGKKSLKTLYNQADDPEYERQLIKYLGSNGIEVSSYKDRYILRRLRVRMGRLKFKSYKDYLDYIKKHPAELGEIQESLSINVTRFFRNRDTYEMVRNEVLRKLSLNKNSLKIWSAGCAVGAEPYSIAMIASDSVPQTCKVSIQATDVKEELLRTARYGIYSKPYLAEMKPTEISRYFNETISGDFKVKPHIKSMVSFKQQDLMKDDFPRNVDLIFCRNVLIYVDRDAQNIILNKFFEALKPGGIVVLGRTETLFGDWRKSVDIISTKHRIYQKKVVGKFEPITMNDPVSDLVGQTLPGLKKGNKRTSRKSTRSSSRTIARTRQKKDDKPSDRLQELRDFRRTFEERKRIWEERMEKNRARREERMDTLKNKTSRFRSTTSTFSTSVSQKKRVSRRSSNDEATKLSSTSSLSEYRKRLKSVKTKESRIRRDLDDK